MANVKTVVHERTKTSREVKELEKQLQRRLESIAVRVRRDAKTEDMFILRQKYEGEVTAIVASAIQAIYLLGKDYVSDFEDTTALLTQQDVREIDQKTKQYVDSFFRLTTRDVVRDQQGQKPVSLGSSTALIAGAAAFTTLATSTVLTAQQTGDRESKVVFITALDELVCPICRPLHGRSWVVGDPAIVQPVQNTHPNCRCRLLLRDNKGLFSH